MTHNHCDHELEHCTHCDVVTCKKCKQEWGAEKPCLLNHWPTYIPYPVYPSVPVYPTWRPYWQINCGGTNFTSMYTLTAGSIQ